ncbi:hypothetical protein [Carbonactinospora thermoautotrophica]|uniref:hypothetical protein n=1 Tax=Carbonactinospora thermoautotrophica TaxID=1469144 RepID=UPI002271D296|nr:hypothetical protein [Carbonactinospora thermoautotrophica]
MAGTPGVDTGDGGALSFYGDPDELDRLAQRLVARAAEVRAHADKLSRRAQVTLPPGSVRAPMRPRPRCARRRRPWRSGA